MTYQNPPQQPPLKKAAPEFTIIDRTANPPRIITGREASAIAEQIAQPLSTEQAAALTAYNKATEQYRGGLSVDEVVAAHPELDKDELAAFLNSLIVCHGV